MDYADSIAKALDLIGVKDRLPHRGLIIIKPNLTNADKPPVTTAVAAAEAVYEYYRACPQRRGDQCSDGLGAFFSSIEGGVG